MVREGAGKELIGCLHGDAVSAQWLCELAAVVGDEEVGMSGDRQRADVPVIGIVCELGEVDAVGESGEVNSLLGNAWRRYPAHRRAASVGIGLRSVSTRSVLAISSLLQISVSSRTSVAIRPSSSCRTREKTTSVSSTVRIGRAGSLKRGA